jgi:uncharacterized membrane protein YgcG
LTKKIEEMVKSKEVYMDKALQAKMVMAEKKNAINQARWEAIREDANRKAAMEERRLTLEERKAMMELIANDNKTMMIDPSTMDAFTREWGYAEREEIMKRRRQERLQRGGTGVGGASGGGHGGGVDGGHGGGDNNVFFLHYLDDPAVVVSF